MTCFSVDPWRGLTALGGLRPLALNQTTPPVGPPGTASDLVFNPSQTALFAVVKGDGMGAGYTYAYPVSRHGSISTEAVVSRPDGLAIAFSMSFLESDGRAVITDPSFGAALVDVSRGLEVSVATKVPVAGEGAICWSVYSARYETVFIFDGGVTNITMVNPHTGAIRGAVVGAAETKGNLDAQALGQFLYVLNGAAYVSVVDNSALGHGKIPREVQNFDLSSLGSRQGFQGLAVYAA